MAIGTPTQIATQNSQTSGQTSVALNIGTIADNTLVTIAYDNNGGHPTSVSDGTNTYVQRDAANRAAIVWSSIYSFFYATGGTFTVTLTIPATSMTETRAWSVSGIATSSDFDTTGGGDAGLSGTAATTATGATTQADEIVFVNLGSANGGSNNITSWPPTTGYTTLGTQNNNVRNIDSGYAYKILSATETSSASDTLASSKEWAFTLATFKAAAAVGAAYYTPVVIPNRFVGPMALRKLFRRFAPWAATTGQTQVLPPDTGVAATATVSATVVKTAVLSPAISATATVTATVVKTAVLTPTVSATSTVSGTVVKTAVLAPSVAATATVTGTVVKTAVLSPSVAATSTVSGVVVKTAVLAPAVNAVATVTVDVVATKVLSATVNATSTVSATVVNTNAPVADTQPNVIAWQNYYH